MKRMLVAVFDGEAKAYEGKFALMQLEVELSITLHASVVIAMRPDGTVAIRDQDAGPLGTLDGSSLGSFIALIGGPIRFAIAAGAGLSTGMLLDLENARIGGDFIDDVHEALTPGKVALIAEVDEGWTAPVDTQMEKLGVTVLRRSMSTVRQATANGHPGGRAGKVALLRKLASGAHPKQH